MNLTARQPTLFMRIHKTAGEALAKQVRDRLPQDTVCPEQFEWQVRDLPPEGLRRFSFFQGHISPSALSGAFASLRVFTVLRSPGERLLSCFYYWKEGSKHTKSQFFDAIAKLSLLEFLKSDNPIIHRATWNVQARLLAGGQFGGVDHQRQGVFGPWMAECSLADEALRALDRFVFVGVAENYELSLSKVYTLMELGEPPRPEWRNVTSPKPVTYRELAAVPEIADALARLVEADQIVYDAVSRRLNGDVHHAVDASGRRNHVC